MNCLTEIVAVLTEVRRVARQLEADQVVTMSRAPRLLCELYETLQIMSGDMVPSASFFHEDTNVSPGASMSIQEATARPPIKSTASHDAARDKTQKIRLVKPAAQDLCRRLCDALSLRLGNLWRPVPSSSCAWHTDMPSVPTEQSQTLINRDRRTLLFHLAVLLDVNECELEFLEDGIESRASYFRCCMIHWLAKSGHWMIHLHFLMRDSLKKNGRTEPNEALKYWKHCNEHIGLVSLLPFNMVAKAFPASQASSAAAERLFSDLGRSEGCTSQSLLSSTLEMCELIRFFVRDEMKAGSIVQSGLLHAKGEVFSRLVRKVSSLVWPELNEAEE
ncbi:hypothetical protein FGB62_57g211 [Gracilaria domingensis]|nr:hypothetical protein FGB62_57g211 [Gracilaria domingensis]